MTMDFSDQETLIQKSVGLKIRELRKAGRMTAMELSARVGISQSQLSKIETGKATISIKVLKQLCKVLERPLSYLFQSEQEVPKVLGTLITVAGPESEALNWFAQEIHRRTDGRISLIPLRASQLGTGVDQVEQLRQGVIDLFVEELAFYQQYSPALNIFSLPYSFCNDAELASFMGSAFFDEHVRLPLLNQGIRLLNRRWNWLRGLEWVLVSTRPVFTPDQIRGLHVRIYNSTILGRFWEEMGAIPVVVPWHEVRTALRDGRIDVLPTHKAHLFPLGFCRHARYVTLLGDTCPALGVAMNELKYRVLPPTIQEALEEACDAAGDYFSELVRTAEETNEIVNISRFNAAYLKVDLAPWKAEAMRVRRLLASQGELPVDFAEDPAAWLDGPPSPVLEERAKKRVGN